MRLAGNVLDRQELGAQTFSLSGQRPQHFTVTHIRCVHPSFPPLGLSCMVGHVHLARLALFPSPGDASEVCHQVVLGTGDVHTPVSVGGMRRSGLHVSWFCECETTSLVRSLGRFHVFLGKRIGVLIQAEERCPRGLAALGHPCGPPGVLVRDPGRH